MQCFAWADAMLCVSVGLNWHRNVCPILNKIKGGKDSPYGALSPQEISTEPLTPSVVVYAFALTAWDY